MYCWIRCCSLHRQRWWPAPAAELFCWCSWCWCSWCWYSFLSCCWWWWCSCWAADDDVPAELLLFLVLMLPAELLMLLLLMFPAELHGDVPGADVPCWAADVPGADVPAADVPGADVPYWPAAFPCADVLYGAAVHSSCCCLTWGNRCNFPNCFCVVTTAAATAVTNTACWFYFVVDICRSVGHRTRDVWTLEEGRRRHVEEYEIKLLLFR